MVTSGKRGVLAGVVAALLGLAAGDLTASLVNPDAAPTVVVGAQVIDMTPTAIKEWAIAHFGTADKPILLVGVALVVLVASGLIGWTAARHGLRYRWRRFRTGPADRHWQPPGAAQAGRQLRAAARMSR